jgi:hypothetical protein
LRQKGGQYDSQVNAVLEMAKRRPVSAVDIANVLDVPLEDVEALIKGLLIKGKICEQKHGGAVFYIAE